MVNRANQITLLRIFTIPFMVLLLYFPGKITCLFAMILFIFASFTDFLDGFLARRYNMVSNLGKFLDPLADKLLVVSALIMLTYLKWLPAWVSILIIGREISVTGLRGIAAEKGVVIAADRYGKLKTIFQVIAICPLILHFKWGRFDPRPWGIVLIYIALVLTLFSGINYIYKFLKEAT